MSDIELSCPAKTQTKIVVKNVYFPAGAETDEVKEVKNRKTFFINEEIDKEEFYNTLYKVLLVILLIAYIVTALF